MERYLYESHTDGVYIKDKPIKIKQCEICGDNDRYLGSFSTSKELIKLMKQDEYIEEYIQEVVQAEFGGLVK